MSKKVFIYILVIMLFLSHSSVITYAEKAQVSLFAGSSSPDYIDTLALESSFNQPTGIDIYKNGDIYIADSANNMIRKISNGKVTTIAGCFKELDNYGFPLGGLKDGNVDIAMFNNPRDLVVKSNGDIFVSDSGNNIIRKISNGKVYTFSGTGMEGCNDGPKNKTQFNMPSGIDIDKNGNLYVADTLNHVIRKISSDGTVTTYAGKYKKGIGGYKDGANNEALFNEPSDLAVNNNGDIYVLDTGNQLVRKISNGQVTTVAGIRDNLIEESTYYEGGFTNGSPSESKFNFPKGIIVSDDGTIFIADTWNNRIRAIVDGEVKTVAGNGNIGNADGLLGASEFNGPMDIAYYNDSLYVCDRWSNNIRQINLSTTNYILDREELIKNYNIIPDDNNVAVYINNELMEFPDAKPYSEVIKMYIPIRFIAEKWGAKVTWISSSNEVQIKKGDIVKIYKPDKDNTILKNSRTYIDTYNLSKDLGIRVEWYREYNAVIITY